MESWAAEQAAAAVVEEVELVAGADVGGADVDGGEVVAEVDTTEVVAEVETADVAVLAGLSPPQPPEESAAIAITRTETRIRVSDLLHLGFISAPF